MATDSADVAVTNTLTGATVDTITLKPGSSPHAHLLVVVNHNTTVTLWFNWSPFGITPADPTVEGNDCIPVLPSSSTSIRLPKTTLTCVVKLIGNANKYTVAAIPGVGL